MSKRPANFAWRRSTALVIHVALASLLAVSVGASDRPEYPKRHYTYAGKPTTTDYPHELTILYNIGYAVGYDEMRGVPAWVAYRVFPVPSYKTHPRPSRFTTDERATDPVTHGHYTHTGYDRGHMAPNFAIATRYGREAQIETFRMTNIIPQTPALNRQWWQRLERLIAREYPERFGDVWVIYGPVYKVKGEWLADRAKVPSHNFKIIVTEVDNQLKAKAFIVPQDVKGRARHKDYLVSIRDIEAATGLDFHPLLDPETAARLEADKAEVMW